MVEHILQVYAGATGHAGGINCLDVSPDGRFLVAVGLNSHSKQLVILWSIAGLVDGQKVIMIVLIVDCLQFAHWPNCCGLSHSNPGSHDSVLPVLSPSQDPMKCFEPSFCICHGHHLT